MRIEDSYTFPTHEAAQRFANDFMNTWGGEPAWNPYDPRVTILEPVEGREGWTVRTSRHDSAE